MNRVTYVGIAGKKFHGKDTFARFVRERLEARGVEVRRRGFADSLKEEVADMLVPYLQGCPRMMTFDAQQIREQLLYTFNFGTKEEKEPFRFILQWWGVEFRRQMFNSEYWLRSLELWVSEELHRTKKDLVVLVPDLRMPNECHFVKNAGGLLVKVYRPGIDTGDQHITETALDDYKNWDRIILNDGALELIHEYATIFCERVLEPRL